MRNYTLSKLILYLDVAYLTTKKNNANRERLFGNPQQQCGLYTTELNHFSQGEDPFLQLLRRQTRLRLFRDRSDPVTTVSSDNVVSQSS